MTKQEIETKANELKNSGILLQQISDELNYREMACNEAKWDDDLFEYTTEELERLEQYIQ